MSKTYTKNAGPQENWKAMPDGRAKLEAFCRAHGLEIEPEDLPRRKREARSKT